MVNRPGRSEEGWSAVEIIVSLGILAILLGSLVVAESRDFRYLGDSFDETKAERAAASRLEAIAAGRGVPAPGRRDVPPDPRLADDIPGVRVEEEVREVEPGLLSVEVRVLWRGAGGAERRISLATLVAVGRTR